MDKILITGSSGGVGTVLVNQLIGLGHEVIGLDLELPQIEIKPGNFSFIKGSITNEQLLEQVPWKSIDKVIHLAAVSSLPECQLNPTKAFDTNFIGTVNIAEKCKEFGVKYLINASTSAIYEEHRTYPFIENMVCRPNLVYSQSKIMSEYFLSAQKSLYGLPSVSLRFFNIVGPYQNYTRKSPPLVNYIIFELINKRIPILHSNGEQRRDYISVYDACNAIIESFNLCDLKENIYNICSGETLSVAEIFALVQAELQINVNPVYQSAEKLWSKYSELFSYFYPLNLDVIANETNKKSLGSPNKFMTATNWKIQDPMAKSIKQICQEAVKFLAQ
jgi:nucleoside-diphosphate-sugar epimerase